MKSDMQKDILMGWKAIEDFIGLRRQAIIRLGFPVRKMGKIVIIKKSDVLRHMEQYPLLKLLKRT